MPTSSSQPPSRLTPALLRQLPDAELPYAVQDHVFQLIAEVKNGAFNQFFWNSSDRRVTDAAEGLDLPGLRDHLPNLLARAVRAEAERFCPG